MTKKRTPIDELSCDFVDTKPVGYDWRDNLGENLDGFTPYEAMECASCGHEFVAVGFCPCCPKCDNEIESADGPMMNYYYPVSLRWNMTLEDAANRISQLPLCMVELKDGTVCMALTGGGMDLSWQIIEAYIALGFLPPVHFLPPPRMAGWEHEPNMEYVLKCCEESADAMSGWAQRKLADVKQLRKERRAALRKKA